MAPALINDGIRLLASRLPRGWSVRRIERPSAAARDTMLDGLLELKAPDGRRTAVAVEAKTRFEPRDAVNIGRLASALRDSPWMVLSRFLSEATRQRLREYGINWLDLSGNVKLELQEPGLFIETAGLERRPDGSSRGARSLKGPSAGRTVRAILRAQPPVSLSALAAKAEVDPGYVSRILDFLVREALVERQPRGPVSAVDRYRLVRRWAEDAPLESRGTIGMYLEPRGLSALVARLKTTPPTGGYALTGSLAAQRWAPAAATRLAQVYVPSRPAEVAPELGVRPTETGANVQLIQPRDRALLDSARRAADGLVYVTPLQAAVDLLSSPGRGPAEGEELLKWMLSQDKEIWRE